MPVCKGCGGSYDNNFQFCPHCGRAKPESEEIKIQVSVSSAEKWETCRIYRQVWDKTPETLGVLSSNKFTFIGFFWAEGIGPNGAYFAGESVPFRIWHVTTKYNGESLAHTFLLNQLVKNGWEATASGGAWWETQFRRRVGGDYPKPWEVWVTDFKWGKIKNYFAAYHVPQGQTNKVVEYGKSTEFKLGFFESNGALHENDERQKLLDSFLQKLRDEGFESTGLAENGFLKKCLADESIGSIAKLFLCWCNRFLIRRV